MSGCQVEVDGFGGAVKADELERRGAIADEIAARAQGVAARVLLEQCNKAERGEIGARCGIARRSVTEAEPAQTSERDDGGLTRIVAGDPLFPIAWRFSPCPAPAITFE
jgi:hypothetical protein